MRKVTFALPAVMLWPLIYALNSRRKPRDRP